MYGCLVWGTNLNQSQIKKLKSLQHSDLTQGAGLDIVTYITPLHLHIKSESMMTRVRTADRVGASWEKINPDKSAKSHITRLEQELAYAKVLWGHEIALVVIDIYSAASRPLLSFVSLSVLITCVKYIDT